MLSRFVLGLTVAIHAAAFAQTSVVSGAPEFQHRTYAVRNIDPADAVSLLCLRDPDACKGCNMGAEAAREPSTAGVRGTIGVTCNKGLVAEGWEGKIAAALAAIDVPPPTYQFHVVVLAASRKDGPSPDLPPSEAKALADFKKVMTYRSFTLEAESVVRTNRGARVQLNSDYDLEVALDPRSSGGDSIHVANFDLRSTHGRQEAGGATSYPTYVETSFDLKRGETLVLGGSISDQAARVVLVTALP